MVMIVHSTEPVYLGGEGTLILIESDAYWASFFDTFVRCCVPLFVIASSYLLFPLRYPIADFFSKRAVRVVVPFVLWSLVYAFYWGNATENLWNLIFNFNYAAGHLWFVYMLIGIYLLMPLLSPWAARVSKKELSVYIGIWLFTTLLPMLRDWLSDGVVVIYGPSGVPMQAQYPLWGEASWNGYGMFYYVSGFVGYLMLGLYFRKFVPVMSKLKTVVIALPCFVTGFAMSFWGFVRRALVLADGSFPITGTVDKAVWLETTWYNDTLGVALMTIACVMMFRKMNFRGWIYKHIVLPVSKASYGMYLCHMIVLAPVSSFVRETMGTSETACLGVWTTPVEIVTTGLCSFVIVALVSILVQRIPFIGKFIMG